MDNNIRLLLNNISVVYSDVIQVLKGVSLKIPKGHVVSLLGSNGAGKTTTLKAISGLLKPENGKVTEGSIEYDGTSIQNSSPEDITRKGIDKFLCKDGQTRWNSPLYGGDKNKYAEFRNRDNRLLYNTPPPYKVKKTGAQTWEHTGVDADKEYFTIMEQISDPLHKTLPDLNWSGNVIVEHDDTVPSVGQDDPPVSNSLRERKRIDGSSLLNF